MNTNHKDDNGNSVVEKRQHSPLLYWGTVITLVLIVITFVFYPIFDFSNQGGDEKLGSFDKKTVFFNDDFRQNWQYQAQYLEYQYQQMYNMQSLPEYFKNSINKQAFSFAFNAMIQQKYILSILDNSKVFVSQEKIDKTISDDILKSQDPKSSLKEYKALSKSAKQIRRDEIEKQLKLQTYSNDLDLIPSITKSEEDFLTSFPKEERKIGYVEISNSTIPNNFYKEYAEKNPKLWSILKLKKITTTSKKEINAVIEKLSNDINQFDEIANEVSIDANPLEIITTTYYELKDELNASDSVLDTITSLTKNDLSTAIKIKSGYVVYKCEEEAVPYSPATIDLEKVKSYISKNDDKTIKEYAKTLTENILTQAKEKSLQESAKTANLAYYVTDFFPINIENSQYLKGIKNSANENVLQNAIKDKNFFMSVWSLEKGAISDLIYLEDSTLILTVLDVKDSAKAEDTIKNIINTNIAINDYIVSSPSYVNNSENFYTKYFTNESK